MKMTPHLRLAVLAAAVSLAVLPPRAYAQLNIPSDGSDGALIVTANTNIDLRQAITGTWSNAVALADKGKGIYDPNKWAVVFKYSSVLIANGATVTFTNHLTHAPVVWLVQGNVTIEGTLNLNGQGGNNSIGYDLVNVPEPGPGGFRGGAKSSSNYGLSAGGGFGPGGRDLASGSYATLNLYGNPQIVPLIGGSGGHAGPNTEWNGGGGGGAILIASSGAITINGSLTANGGDGYFSSSGSGSGGGVRLVANQILGNGRIEATSHTYPGRIRLEANSTSLDLRLNPITSAAVPSPLVIWPEASAPIVKIISVGGQSAPADPKAPLAGPASDMTIATTNTVTIILQSANFPTNGTVNVHVKPRNAAQSILAASLVGGNSSLATWQVTTTLLPAYSVIQARAVAP